MLSALALACLALTPSARAAPSEDLKELARALRDPWPDARERAVRKLAAHGTEEAWLLVVGALADSSGRVADAAQVALGELAEPRVLGCLLGPEGLASRKDVVRLRAAETFGRMAGPLDGERLARALSPTDAGVARALLWSVERLAAREALAGRREPLVRAVEACLGRQREPRLRAAALVTLARLDPERARGPARAAATDRAAALRCAGLEVLARLDGAAAVPLARTLAADPDAGVRRAALDRLAGCGTRPALEALVERLGNEPRERLARVAVAHLQRLSGLRHGTDPRPWSAWLGTLPPDWRGAPPAAPRKPDERASRAASVGLPVHSDRAAYLIDFSGSLWNERTGGKTRKERLDEVLRTTLERLPAGARFNIVPYTARPYPWREELADSGPRERRAARAYFDGLRITGPGDAYGAITHALRDPELDTICLLTDGAPTGGVRWDMGLMVELLLQDTRHRPVTFDVVLIDCPKGLARHWRELAETTGGTCVALEL
jgi:HEAT repeat protein